ncbi:MAG TPA: hypothetical protein VGE14_05805 [Marmoricola sp.]
MNRKLIGAVAATALAASAALTLGSASPATADSIGVKDADDVRHGVDLRSVRVVNSDRNVRIVLTHTNLRRDPRSGAGGAVYIDTDPADRGPELVFAGGYFEGTDYQLLHTEGFGVKKWGKVVDGFHILRLDYDREQTRMRMSRKAVGNVDDVRVAVRVAGDRRDGTSVVDWLGEPRSYTPWVEQG